MVDPAKNQNRRALVLEDSGWVGRFGAWSDVSFQRDLVFGPAVTPEQVDAEVERIRAEDPPGRPFVAKRWAQGHVRLLEVGR